MVWMAPRPACPAQRASVLSVRTSSPVLVGRDTELAMLVDLVAERPCAVLLEGEAGMGKTRLVQELVSRPELTGTRILTGSCQSLAEPFPYGPVLEALRGVAEQPPGPLSPVVGVLRPLLPEIAELLPPQPDPLPDKAAQRHREFRAIRELLGACGPTLLVIDDLHWADERTRDVLWFVLSRPPEQLGVVVTYRSEDLRSPSPLGVPYRPAEGVRAAMVHLGPLDVPAVRRMAEVILDAPRVADEFATKLHESTAGIPFVVEETLRALRGPALEVDRAPGHRLLDRLEVPVLLREAMTERLCTLSDNAIRVARCAAVLGVPATASLIGALAGLRGRQLATALAQALESGVLREDTPDLYGFRHPLAGKSVYDAISGPERQLLHARAMRALAATDPPPLGQLAEHARAAGRVAEWVRYAEAAADQAIELGETATAIEALQSVLDGADPSDVDAGRMAVKLSQVALRGLRPGVTRTLERVLAQCRLDRATRGTIRVNTGLLLVRKAGELSRGRAQVQRAIEELAGDPEQTARGINLLAQPIDGTTSLEWHQQWMDRARAVHDQLTNQELRLALTADRLAGRMHIGDGSAWTEFTALREEKGEAIAADSVAERVQLARFWGNLADAAAWVGHYARADELLKEGLQIATPAGALYVTGNGQSTRVRLDWVTGNWTGLAEAAEALRAKYRDLMAITAESSLVLAGLAAVRGDFGETERHLAETSLLHPGQGVAPVVLAAAGMLTWVRLAAGDLPGALAAADQGMTAARAKGVWVWAAELIPWATEAYAQAERWGDAETAVREYAEGIAGRDAPAADAGLVAAEAVLLAARGKHPEAAVAFAEAHNRYAALPMPYPAHWASERAALSRLADGDSTATAQLGAAAEGYEALGATRDAGRCRHLLREHGAWAPSQRGRRGYGRQLSPREREVAEMLAEGRTNREIATGLFLSPRTVEQHVANVLRKLGARSRTEVARHSALLTSP
ncbi:LuxR family transcriptional regulator [Amycolatopsis suaedae]|uniref:LuxR family transcriptional regulator n=1 Tax=Amycolatopsis suaedae TaxID=2510978 RepID=A0A4Q7J3E8_9PSEU|nr:LuxR family transcriptional regulator [Amycolatopsis suaedae]RZQ62010.1 LuxR family transcriptional regulator [Amycolatopsis suaedae]